MSGITVDGIASAAGRVIIRTLRIACGIVLAAVAIVIYWNIPDVSSTPFAQLTLGSLFWSLIGWIGIAVLCTFAWGAAFGPGPSKQ